MLISYQIDFGKTGRQKEIHYPYAARFILEVADAKIGPEYRLDPDAVETLREVSEDFLASFFQGLFPQVLDILFS